MVEENFLCGYLQTPRVDGASSPDEFDYVFIFSQEGLELVKTMRAEEGKDDSWWPGTLPYTSALARIAARYDTHKIRRLAGFPDEHVPLLIELTEEELSTRKNERERANEGVDPDDKFFAPKTPKKTKPSQELSRVHDKVASSSQVQFPSDVKDLPKFKPSSSKENPVYMKIEDEDAACLAVARNVIKKEEGTQAGDLSDYTNANKEITVD